MKLVILTLLISSLTAFSSCANSSSGVAGSNSAEISPRREELKSTYPYSPREEIFDKSEQNQALLAELRDRYRSNLVELKKSIEGNRAKMVVAYLSPEFGGKMYTENEPFIEQLSTELGVQYIDITKALEGKDPTTYTQLPKDGHFSKLGSSIVAEQLDPILRENNDYHSDVTFQENQRAATFGDLPPSTDEIKGTERDLPYRVITNSKGLRMEKELAFPKKRQRVLLLGDSQAYFPYLDNQFIATDLLQKTFPDKEIINAANYGYSVDDYLSLYNEKAKFTEADIVIIATNGGDITDQYFAHRNLYSRSATTFEPSKLEMDFYPKITSR